MIPAGSRWTQIGEPTLVRPVMVPCRCECGVEKLVNRTHLKAGRSKQCAKCSQGKARLSHGHARGGKSPEYITWQRMNSRCRNAADQAYPYYGGRGIRVCKTWESDFPKFLSDMGPRPDRSYTLDRIDVDEGYTRENCRWVQRDIQNHNKRARSSAGELGVYARSNGRFGWSVCRRGIAISGDEKSFERAVERKNAATALLYGGDRP